MTPSESKDLVAYSPMLHARLFSETQRYRENHFQPVRSGEWTKEDAPAHLDGNPSMDRPLFVQFCTNDPDEFLAAAQHVAPFCDAVDLNLGCPQGIAKKGHYGAFLQEDWNLIYRLINKLHHELPVPITAKFRIQETKEKTLEYAKMILSAGANIITVHGRTREQKGHNTGLADWSYLRYLRENLPEETVIFANGNILCHDDIEECLKATGADGVMSAEANLSDPTVFAKPPSVGEEGSSYWRGKDGKGGYRVDAVFRRYLEIIYKHVLETEPPQRKPLYMPGDKEDTPDLSEHPDEPPRKKQRSSGKEKRATSPNLTAMQGHLFGMLRPLVTKHTNVRDALARSKPGDMAAFENVLTLTEAAVKEGLKEYEQHPELYDYTSIPESEPQSTNTESSAATLAKHKRPYWICQPYIRPLPAEAFENGAMTLSKKEKAKLEAKKAGGAAASGSSTPTAKDETTEETVGEDGEKVEVAKEGLVCG